MTGVRRIELADGHAIPQLGYGVWQVEDDIATDVVGQALQTGFRHLDTAAAYGNEAGVGRAIAAANEVGIPRDELFVTSKLWNAEHGYDRAMRAFDESMGRLGLDVLDLFLIHWPVPSQDRYVETFRALIDLRAAGRIRSIGVSNFAIAHLERLADETGVVPAVNQIELHPRFNQAELRAYHAEHGIVTESWSPLGNTTAFWKHEPKDVAALDHPLVADIAKNHDASPAQVLLAWNMALGNVVISKSSTPGRIAENFAAAEVSLADDEVEAITALDNGDRIGKDPSDG